MGSPGAVLDSFQLGLHLLFKKNFLCPVCQGGYIRVKLVLSELGLTGLLDIYSIVCTHTYMGHFPKLCTKSVTFAVRIQNNWLLFSTLLQQFLSKTSGLSKWTKRCNIPVQIWEKSWPVKAVQHCFTNWMHAVNIHLCQVGIFYKSWVYSPIILYQCWCISQCIPQVLVQHLLSLLLGVMHHISRLLNTLMDLKYVQLECECMVQLAWIIRLGMRLQNTAVFSYYVLGFAPALRFLQRQVWCRLYKSPLDEIINQGPLCVYACKKITYSC